jgi:hypothetical protein
VGRSRAADDLAKIRMRVEPLRRERVEALHAEDDWGQRSASKARPARFVTGKAREEKRRGLPPRWVPTISSGNRDRRHQAAIHPPSTL